MRWSLTVVLAACCSFIACSRAKPPTSAVPQADAPTADLLADPIVHDPKRKAIFDAVLHHALTDPRLADSRNFYGTPGDRKFALVTNTHYGVPWPDWYIPAVEDFECTRALEGSVTDAMQPRLLGIRLNKFNTDDRTGADTEDQAEAELFSLPDGEIAITLLNAGGNAGGVAIRGGCTVYYDVERDGDEWIVKYIGAID